MVIEKESAGKLWIKKSGLLGHFFPKVRKPLNQGKLRRTKQEDGFDISPVDFLNCLFGRMSVFDLFPALLFRKAPDFIKDKIVQEVGLHLIPKIRFFD